MAQRGEVYIVAIHESEIVGSEQGKSRRFVVVSANTINNSLAIVIGVPLSQGALKHKNPTNPHRIHVPASEIRSDPGTVGCGESIAKCEQVRVLGIERLGVPPVRVATLTPAVMAKIELGLAYALGMP